MTAIEDVLDLMGRGITGPRLDSALETAGWAGGAAARMATTMAARVADEDRARELIRILYDTAGDLAALRDVEAVLLAIVQRTRAITGADMAYVSLNDHDRGETYIRKSDGVRTDAYRNIRMPLGTGVLGKAATGSAVVTTLDYCTDPQLVHLDEIDAIVAGEGVKSIMGVPMNVHGRVQGALLIADRRPVEYSATTREMVDTIARQAAVAIDYSARLGAVTRALADLGERQSAGQLRLAELQDLLALDRRMVEVVVTRGGTDAILGLLSDAYGAPAELLGPEGGADDPALARALASAVATGQPVPLEPRGVTVAAARAGDHHFGSIVVHALVPADQRDLLVHAALHVSVSKLMDRIEAAAAHRSHFELLDDLISERKVARATMEARLVATGLNPRMPMSMVTLDVDADPEAQVDRIRALLPGPAVVASHADHVCALTQGEVTASLRTRLVERGQVRRLSWATVEQGVAGVRAAHRLAEVALGSLRLLGGTSLAGEQLGSLGALLEADSQGRLPRSLTAPVEPLAAADRERGSDLVRTAWAMLQYGPVMPTVAAQLFIHPNTLRQRLRRIAGLLTPEWNTGPGRLDLHLALHALMLRRALGEQVEHDVLVFGGTP